MGDIREPLRELTECGLPQALEVMGERWSFMILRASFNGLHHFEEFLSELGIARNILSNRLAKLVEHGILKRDPCADDKRKTWNKIAYIRGKGRTRARYQKIPNGKGKGGWHHPKP